MLREAKLPYIVVLTNPTTGGVTASYAMLGDVQIAEPGALIGFAGAARHRADHPRETAGRFPARRISADHGMVDMVVHRHDLRPTLARLCRLLTKSPALESAPKAVAAGRPNRIPPAPDAAPAAPPRERARRRPRPPLDELIARLSALHPKSIDLALDRMRRAAGAARSSRAQAAAGHSCRRHQWQGLDHRLSARDPGGGGLAGACLYLAVSGADQRALSLGGRRRHAGRRRRTCATR